MIISNITPPQVWSSSARSLTNIGSGALAPTSTTFTSFAAGSNVDLRPAIGIVGQITIAVQTGGAATLATFIDLFDGTSAVVLAQTAAAANAAQTASSTNTHSVGTRVRNGDGANASNYMTAAFVWTI